MRVSLQVVIVAGMALFLAVAAQQMLCGLVTAASEGLEAIEVRARAVEPLSPPMEWPELRLTGLVVDGRRVRFDATEYSSGWNLVATRGRGVPADLVCSGGAEVSTLQFQGARCVIVGEARAWSGQIEIQRGSEIAPPLEISVPAGRSEQFVIEAPSAPPSTVILVAALVAFATVAAFVAPWRSERRAYVWFALFLLSYDLLYWASQCIGTTNDSRGYSECFAAAGRGVASYFPPGYPLFFGVIERLSGPYFSHAITIAQHFLMLASTLWMYSIARRLLPIELALMAGVLIGTAGPTSVMAQSLMSEAPTVFAMVGTMYFALQAAEKAKSVYAVTAGLLAAAGGLLRVIPLIALLPAVGIVLLASRAEKRFRLLTIATASSCAVIVVTSAWFAFHTGSPSLATSTGTHLYDRVVFEQQLLDDKGPATQVLIKILGGADPRKFPAWDMPPSANFEELPAEYQSNEQLFLKVAAEAFRRFPRTCLMHTPVLAWRIFVSDASSTLPTFGDSHGADIEYESPSIVGYTASTARWELMLSRFHRALWPVLCWGAVAGSLVGWILPQRWLVLSLAVIPVIFLLSQASLEIFLARYNIPMIPFVIVLAMVPPVAFGHVWSVCRKRFASEERTEFAATV